MTDTDPLNPTIAEAFRTAVSGHDPIRFEVDIERSQNTVIVKVTARRRGVSAQSTATQVIHPDHESGERSATCVATSSACRMAVDRVLGAELAIAHVMMGD